MPYLQNEKARSQADVQKAEDNVTSLTAQAEAQQQAIADAQSQENAAQGQLTDAQSQLPPLQAAAAAADQNVATLNSQVNAMSADEPDPFIIGPLNKPIPNPGWKNWKKSFDQLTEQRNQAQSAATLAHSRLNAVNQAVSQAAADLQAAQARAAQATAILAQLNQALSAGRDQLAAAQQRLNDLIQWSDEIDRDPMDRSALEQTAAELSSRVMELEDNYAAAVDASAAADAALASLMTRRDRLLAELTDINNQLPAANAAVQAADSSVSQMSQQISDQISGGP